VSKRNNTPPPPVTILSLGAGVQSSTMALMAAAGEITPMPDCAIFADTQAEPKAVYAWLDWLETRLPFPVHRVTAGSLTDAALKMRTSKDGRQYTQSLIPLFTLNTDGSQGKMMRTCTAEFKVKPLVKKQRQVGRIRRGQKTPTVTVWIGISVDEAHRMKPSREPWAVHRWPLIDLRMTRADCLAWMTRHGYPQPPRSACVYCPFHNEYEWDRLQREDPGAFSAATWFDREMRRTKALTDNMREVPYLHPSLKPLSEVVFDPMKDEPSLFGNECEGMCGV
jgi:hypothetical protein